MLIAEKIRVQMIILEILEHIEDADLEDWLTAAFIENEHQLPLKELCTNDGYPSPSGVVDIWMVEITSRNGNVWSGKFNVEFSEESKNGSEPAHWVEHQSGEILFTLDIKTAEITFKRMPWPSAAKRILIRSSLRLSHADWGGAVLSSIGFQPVFFAPNA